MQFRLYLYYVNNINALLEKLPAVLASFSSRCTFQNIPAMAWLSIVLSGYLLSSRRMTLSVTGFLKFYMLINKREIVYIYFVYASATTAAGL